MGMAAAATSPFMMQQQTANMMNAQQQGLWMVTVESSD
jgi:hypothetical protein